MSATNNVHYMSFYNFLPNMNFFDCIKKNIKTIECRKNEEKYDKIEVNHFLRLFKRDLLIECEITDIKLFKDISDFVENTNISDSLCNEISNKDAIDLYHKNISEYKINQLKEERNYGIKAFYIKYKSIHNLHQVSVKQPWFSFLKNCTKKYEGRLNTDKYQAYKKGDYISFMNGKLCFFKQILGIKTFKSLEEMFDSIDVNEILPNHTKEQGIKIYLQFYNKRDIDKYGMVCYLVNH